MADHDEARSNGALERRDLLKLGAAARMNRKRTLLSMAVATVVAIVVGFYACLTVSYEMGWGTAKVYVGPQWASRWFFSQGVSWLTSPTQADWPGVVLPVPRIVAGGAARIGGGSQ